MDSTVGTPSHLIGKPVTYAERYTNQDPRPEDSHGDDSWTYTIFDIRVATHKVIFKWLGESNGYYSEEVDFAEVK